MRKILSRIKILKNTSLVAMVFFFIVGIVMWGGFNTAMEVTNEMSFCISCHEMESTVYQEYKHSSHFTNRSGVSAVCSDCHVPKEWWPKVVRKIQASKEVLHWLKGSIDTAEKFEAKRHELATRVWDSMKASDSRECRNCHQFSAMALKDQTRFAARIHGDAPAKGKTCIDCHKGITHKLPQLESQSIADKDLDIEYAEDINGTCAGCHGEFGEGSSNGEYPRLAGLDAAYLAKQLRDFKSRDRLNIPMTPYTTERELPEEDVVLIAAYLSQIKLKSKLPPIDEKKEFDALERLKASGRIINIARYAGNLEKGKQFYNKECAACHGDKAQGKPSMQTPQLVGQYSIYLKRQIDKYRNGERIHDDPRDADIFKSYSDTDIENMLAYLSILDD
ncbi:MAG: NapC/NirT family cytochrome c [Gammaproteobacteria bacterium]|nr:NapC/NirT family cytochrome c [Gammaproteobacteria bacterium]